jgi:hypothetical protein
MRLKDHTIIIPIDSGPSNLPMIWNPSISAEEQREIGLQFVSKLEFCDLPGMSSMFQVPSFHPMVDRVDQGSWEDASRDFICACVGMEENTNLLGPQKELLTWHWKLGVGMQRILEMMWETKAIDDDGRKLVLPPVFIPTFAYTLNCPIPMCHSGELACQKRRSPKVKQSHAIPEKEALLSRD